MGHGWRGKISIPFKIILQVEFIRNAVMAFVIYDITRKESFEVVEDFIKEVKLNNVLLGVLVGNKIDLGDEREVSLAQGSSLASQYGLQFEEISATNLREVEELLKETIHMYCQRVNF